LLAAAVLVELVQALAVAVAVFGMELLLGPLLLVQLLALVELVLTMELETLAVQQLLVRL
jgi:hypothetical protein